MNGKSLWEKFNKMNLSFLLDAANVIFFSVGIPQMRSAYLNRDNLNALSTWMLGGCLVACIMFSIANSSFGAYIGGSLNIASSTFYITQLYWKFRGKK